MSKVFITGIAGFLGSHIADEFIHNGDEVAGNDNLIGGYEDNVPKEASFYPFDCRSEQIKTILNDFKPDLIIVPLAAFDHHHNRLGYGKGYYDRFLGKYRKKNKNIITIGLAFSFQKYKKIPVSKFDIKLDYILTEKGIF